jgi:hypothetical protein
MLHRQWMLTLALLVAALMAAPAARAQALSGPFVAEQSPAAPVGPTFQSARAGVTAPVAVNATNAIDENLLAPQHQGLGKSVALMIVGGAAIVTGAIIGGGPGALVAVAGAGVGLYGLYLYLQ